MPRKGTQILDPKVLAWVQSHQSMKALKEANEKRRKGLMSANDFIKLAERKFRDSQKDPLKQLLGRG